MNARVIGLNFGSYLVDHQGKTLIVHWPKTDKSLLSPVVGDQVSLDSSQSIITGIMPRQSFIKRPRIANLSSIYVVSSVSEPEYSFLLNAMFISFARYYNLKVHVIISKIDLYPSFKEDVTVKYLSENHIPITYFSKLDQDTTVKIAQTIQHHTIVAFAGQTGVGKSSIINAINPSFNRSIGDYSKALGRGKHQTKEVLLVRYQDSYIADTPGFSSIVLPFTKHEAAQVFPGFETRFTTCKFSNCTHIQEPDCQVKKDVMVGKIPQKVYDDYCQMLEKLPHHKEYA
jgi:ribosome biogenesis GTPase